MASLFLTTFNLIWLLLYVFFLSCLGPFSADLCKALIEYWFVLLSVFVLLHKASSVSQTNKIKHPPVSIIQDKLSWMISQAQFHKPDHLKQSTEPLNNHCVQAGLGVSLASPWARTTPHPRATKREKNI